MRDLASWVQGFGVSETEFRLLWLLREHERGQQGGGGALDQADIAERLAVSAAQVSGVVERLRERELVDRVLSGGDRRRQLWRLAPTGETLVLAVVASVEAQGGCGAQIPLLAPRRPGPSSTFEGGGFAA